MKHNYNPKPAFIERIKLLLKDKEDINKFFENSKTKPKKSFIKIYGKNNIYFNIYSI